MSPLYLHNLCNGIGDTVCGLYAACGLANATGEPVVFQTPHAEWFDGIHHPGVTLAPAGKQGVDMVGGRDGQEHQILHAASRCQDYCDNIAKALNLPAFTPARPHTTPIATPNGYVLLAPFATARAREWPAPLWAQLAGLLIDQGHAVHAITSPDQAERLADRFKATTATLHADLTAAQAIALTLGASLVVANDSGIAHVAGLLDVQTLALHAGTLPHDFLFGMAASVTSLTPTHAKGRADGDVQAMCDLPLERVADAVVGMLAAPSLLA